jgi:hypothetical protein
LSPEVNSFGRRFVWKNAYDQSTYSQRTPESVGEIEVTGVEELSAAPRCVHAGDDAHAEEAELCPA